MPMRITVIQRLQFTITNYLGIYTSLISSPDSILKPAVVPFQNKTSFARIEPEALALDCAAALDAAKKQSPLPEVVE